VAAAVGQVGLGWVVEWAGQVTVDEVEVGEWGMRALTMVGGD